eukprot:1179268-Prorocentrum_minimum.AAC.2
MRRARPIDLCGTSPSPAISFDVSTTIVCTTQSAFSEATLDANYADDFQDAFQGAALRERQNLRHTRDAAHPGRCHPPTIRALSRDLVVEFVAFFRSFTPQYVTGPGGILSAFRERRFRQALARVRCVDQAALASLLSSSIDHISRGYR